MEAAYRQELHSASSTIASLLPTREGARLHAAATTDYYFALRKVSPPPRQTSVIQLIPFFFWKGLDPARTQNFQLLLFHTLLVIFFPFFGGFKPSPGTKLA